MNSSAHRPKKGLSVYEALKRWSNEAVYAELVGISGQEEPPAELDGAKFGYDAALLKDYKQKRASIELAFTEMLGDGALVCSAIADYSDRRDPIPPSLWEDLEIAYDLTGDVYGPNGQFRHPEFFQPSAIPLNVLVVPGWIAELVARFQAIEEPVIPGQIDWVLFSLVGDKVAFGRGVELSKAETKIFKFLLKQWLEDQGADKELSDYGYLRTEDITDALDTDDAALRKRVARLRKKVGRSIIESAKWNGYRLRPDLIQVPHAVIRANLNSKMSHSES
jgi:biotin operon repressor